MFLTHFWVILRHFPTSRQRHGLATPLEPPWPGVVIRESTKGPCLHVPKLKKNLGQQQVTRFVYRFYSKTHLDGRNTQSMLCPKKTCHPVYPSMLVPVTGFFNQDIASGSAPWELTLCHAQLRTVKDEEPNASTVFKLIHTTLPATHKREQWLPIDWLHGTNVRCAKNL